ncbi:MAG: NAD-dependent succinate-semialdehyde dehydrogenase [Methylocystis sp.]|jgi:succinate-semialdehyde dehydrogenase/glutarate-semialdehyde dehydrogenase|nr:NAD-dependent succinate-semialdehyde dehydrogenase [Methylocystis sp.]MCA3582764.1 NAD-dependent succinate-semialdehyde dehydrogenase [Methylocystis sp.]MCA3588480.1 NAD-dependent succinate-semialdehyde dehydrogenase [Methylocystis sp.]MCA3592061.1 NAD-dependent succinate-semialdehyde dehydrogenase [Methylocystis sp.]
MLTLKDPTLLKSQCYINGVWIGDGTNAVENPATGEVLASVPDMGAAETTAAVEAADAAFKLWSKKLAKERSAIMRKWFDLIMANQEDIAQIMTAEQGKPLAESRGEVAYAASFVEFYAEEAKRIYGETIPSPFPNSRIIVQKQAIGVCAAITPWNFPAAMITRKCAPGLAAGCTFVVKPAPDTPLTALALAELAHRAGLPAGVLNIVTGDAVAIGGVMTSHPAVRFVGFTGSTPVGKLLMKQAADTVKKVGLELGGNAPFIVFDDADLDAAVQGAIIAKYRNMGQTCVCTNRLYVQAGIHDRFVEKFAAEVIKLKVGNGAEVGVMQGPLINGKAMEKVERHVQDAIAHGAKVAVGGKRHALGRTFFEPTVLTGVTTKMLVTTEETFGPVASIYKFESESEVVALANATQYGLASYFYTKDLGRAFRVAEALEYGMVGINSAILGTEVAPFGGVKESGLGREGGKHGMDEFVEHKYMLVGGLG